MPALFNKCLKTKGSKIRTLKVSKNRYRRVCILLNGKEILGEIKTKKKT